MSVQVLNRFGKVVGIAKTWRQMQQDSRRLAEKARSRDNRLLDAKTGSSLMSGGSLEKFSIGREDKDRARQPEKSWKSYPNRSGRTIRQWRVV